ncbi:hypothetical protein GCM10011354_20440 [Egicoccus halophilus]|uniref:EAL domain-containing protein n=1 Tax=Egicoccus halophilus TaxID=1670830 RepID=A0A8J3AAV1_9ACTN|nr:hypothetical protein GCM10011354_20440 [Egicoccus halophilus]
MTGRPAWSSDGGLPARTGRRRTRRPTPGATVLAEKVEDAATWSRALACGAALLQGYFVTRPETVRPMRTLALPAPHLALLRRCRDETLDLHAVPHSSAVTCSSPTASSACCATRPGGDR